MSHITKPRWLYEVLDNNRLRFGSKVVVPERKTAAVLSYLALEKAASRSKLAGLLWPDTEEATARNNLSQTLRRFRQLTEELLIVAGNDLQLGERLEVDAPSLEPLPFQAAPQKSLLTEAPYSRPLTTMTCPSSTNGSGAPARRSTRFIKRRWRLWSLLLKCRAT